VLKARKRLQSLTSGDTLRVETDDPAALIDIPHFCAEAGHTLVDTQDTDTGHSFTIRKA
jgi:tRNA 2-thiouridine synthesizing protein A